MGPLPTSTHLWLCPSLPPEAVPLIYIILFLAIANFRICASLMNLGGGRYGTKESELIGEVSITARMPVSSLSLTVFMNRDSALRPSVSTSYYSRSPLPPAPKPQDSNQSFLR